MTAAQISRRLKIPHSTTRYILRELFLEGLIDKEIEKNTVKVKYPKGDIEWLKNLKKS